ncbi:MAG TPA: hypothetical protein VFS18_02850, partial [Actinomycetota bacterium]|nr:hypothetical protein [Actinomycetota bacterium]
RLIARDSDSRFRFDPPDDKTRRVIDGLAENYRSKKTRVIGLIFAGPSESVRSFADAFKLREED